LKASIAIYLNLLSKILPLASNGDVEGSNYVLNKKDK